MDKTQMLEDAGIDPIWAAEYYGSLDEAILELGSRLDQIDADNQDAMYESYPHA